MCQESKKQEHLWIAALLVVAMGIVLLVGNRLHTSWAGGTGFEQHFCANAEDIEFCRGEIISTMPDNLSAPQIVYFGTATIFVDENTEINFVDGRIGNETINVLQGRVVIDGKINIQTRDIKTYVDGKTSFVHYSWLDEIEVANISGTTKIEYSNKTLNVKNEAVKISTIENYKYNFIEFDPSSSSASEFYKTVLQ
ncbi:hypothetical protein KJ766_03480 [Patescibacteria group bacterium]|nr:hypothetical protein [Patescibacteria group bacterium]